MTRTKGQNLTAALFPLGGSVLLYVRRADELVENRGWRCAVARISREVVFEDTVVK